MLTAGNLASFEELAGPDGLKLDHPAELVLRLRHSDRLACEESSAELALALAERALAARDDAARVGRSPTPGRLPEGAG